MKEKLICKICLLLIFGSFSHLSCSKKDIIAEVDNSKIYFDDVVNEVKMNKEKYDPLLLKIEKNADVFRGTVLEELVQEAVLLNEAGKKGISIEKKELDEFLKDVDSDAVEEKGVDISYWRDKQKKRGIIKKLINEEVFGKIPIEDKEVHAYYLEHKKEFFQPPQFHARQILVDEEDQAKEILKKLKDGGDFGKLAEEFSLSPDGSKGGDLGYFSASSFPPIFSQICSKLKEGEVSGVEKTEYGFQIFQLLDKRQGKQLEEKDVKEKIIFLLREEKGAGVFKDWFSKLKSSSKIVINKELLKKIDVN